MFGLPLNMKIYIACGLTHVPRTDFLDYVSVIKNLAAYLENNFNASVKYALRDSDPQLAEKPFQERANLCYSWDRQMVEQSDLIIAESSFPSIGLGIELQIAESRKIPIIIVFRRTIQHKAQPINYETPDEKEHFLQLGDGYVSLMALGIPSVLQVVPYINSLDLHSSLEEHIVGSDTSCYVLHE